MPKAWIAAFVTALAVAVLVALIMNSRSVDVQDYNAHYQTASILDQSVANYDSLLDQIASARRDGRPIGSGAFLMRNLLVSNKEAVSSVEPTPETVQLQAEFLKEIQSIVDLSTEISTKQNIVGNALTQIRDSGPTEVQKMKASGYEVESNAFFRLLLNTLAYGTPGSTIEKESISVKLDALKNNGKLLSSSMVSMIDAMDKVLTHRSAVEQGWKELVGSNFAQVTTALANKRSIEHASRMRNVDNSQALLSIFSMMLFGGLGLLGYRLHASYGEINQVNEQLVDANETLESRVNERTQELEMAFDELKESQVQLVQAEKMSSLGQLVAGISHEINTPLLYLQSNQTLIKETLGRVESFIRLCHDKLIPRASAVEDKEVIRQRYVQGLQELKNTLIQEEVKEEIEELLTLTEDNIEGLGELTVMAQGLKDFSRLDRAPIDSFNVNDGIKRTLVIAKNMLKNKVSVEQVLNEVPLVKCSPSQINQIFLNLITNAAQAIEGEGTITITTTAESGYVMVAVKDTGCGIPEEIIAKIRDPFFTTKEVGTGTGLGLSIVEEILRSHNGRLDITSELGVGSTFTVLLPFKAEEKSVLNDDSEFLPSEDLLDADASDQSESLALVI